MRRAAAGVDAGGFDPSDLGADLKWWYDFSDESTITATGPLVDAVTDKSTSSLDLASTLTRRPSTGLTTKNSLNVLDFAADILTTTAAKSNFKFMHDGAEYWVSMVASIGAVADPDNNYGIYGTNGASSNETGTAFFWEDRVAQGNEGFRNLTTRGVNASFCIQTADYDIAPPQTWMTVSTRDDPDNGTAADRFSLWIDSGSEIATNTVSNAVNNVDPTYDFQIGATGNNANSLTGSIAEILCYTTDSRADVETYLGTKWSV